MKELENGTPYGCVMLNAIQNTKYNMAHRMIKDVVKNLPNPTKYSNGNTRTHMIRIGPMNITKTYRGIIRLALIAQIPNQYNNQKNIPRKNLNAT